MPWPLKKPINMTQALKTFNGSINYGHIHCRCEETLASEILVYMIVVLKEHFKQVIGYFLIDKNNAQTQAQLVRDAMKVLSQTGHLVKAVVCDGNFSNQSMATNLGCNFDLKNMKTFIENEESGQQAHFLFDACHLFKKNVRNCFREWGVLKNKSGERINWQYVKELHNLQCTDNLVLANKLKAKHINCDNNKMRCQIGYTGVKFFCC